MDREPNPMLSATGLVKDVTSGIVVFLVALPLCLGIALASGAELISGIISGIIGGVIIGFLSGSHTSVSGPAAGLTAIVATQIGQLGSYEAFLLAVCVGGVIQIAMGLAKFGFIAAFFPSSVIKGLLAAIGIIILIKQIPYVLGLTWATTEGFGHFQIFRDLVNQLSGDFTASALMIGVGSVAVLELWSRYKPLKNSIVPAPLVVVLASVAAAIFFKRLGGGWEIPAHQLVDVPVANNLSELGNWFRWPDYSQILNPAIYIAGFTIAVVASLETLLNLEAVDNLDPKQRSSPASRELFAQGVGNLTAGLIGGLPVTSVIVRGSVNINAGAQTKRSAIIHGVLLAAMVALLPAYLNLIPLSCLAAILVVTGLKLASPKLFKQLWSEGRYQFGPFIITVIAIVVTDLLIGILIGLATSLAFILYSNYQRPIRTIIENHLGGKVHHIELANQVSFLNRAALDKAFRAVPRDGHLLIDASNTAYLDPDILELIREFRQKTAPAFNVQVSLKGFRDRYRMQDEIRFVDYSTRELQQAVTPEQVLQLLREGNERFRTQRTLPRDTGRQVSATAQKQFPMAVVMSCMDSRTPTELIFDLGLGDVLNICVAGNVMVGPRVLASVEYGCGVEGAKLVVAMAHTGSPIIRAAVEIACLGRSRADQDFGEHFVHIVEEISHSITPEQRRRYEALTSHEQDEMADQVLRKHILRSLELIRSKSRTVEALVSQGKIGMIAAVYDVKKGWIEFLKDSAVGMDRNAIPPTPTDIPVDIEKVV